MIGLLRTVLAVWFVITWMSVLIFLVSSVAQIAVNQTFTTPCHSRC